MPDLEHCSSELTIPGDGSSGGTKSTQSSFPTRGTDAGTFSEDAGTSVNEETPAIVVEQPVGTTPSVAAMGAGDPRNAQSSVDNLLPTKKLENGLKHAKTLLATGWADLTTGMRDLEKREAVGRLKDGTLSIIDRSMDEISKVASKVAEVSDQGAKVVGAQIENAAPTVNRWRYSIVSASERAFASAKEMADTTLADMKNRRKGNGPDGNEETVWGTGGSELGSGPGEGGANADSDTDGPHTV